MVEPRHAAPSDLQHRFDPHEFTPEQRLMWLSQAMQFATICRGITRR